MKRKLCFFITLGYFIINCAEATINPQNDVRVQKVYEHLEKELIWMEDGVWTKCGKTLLDNLAHVEEDGLWPENYLPILETIQKQDLSSSEGQKEADALLTLAALNYVSDMSGERLNPKKVDKNIFIEPVSVDEAELLKSYLSLPDNCGWIHNLAPGSTEYVHLKQLLALYRQKQAQGGWPVLSEGTKLKKGDRGSHVETLKAQLIAQDVLSAQGQGGDVFDDVLEKAVKKYQDLHGLEQDGVVGGATLKALNTSVEERIRSIIVSLERLRWLPTPMPTRYIQVNIPGFYLKAVGEDGSSFFMPIITGREYRKTPVFYAPMTEIIFNPSWHVPTSIAVKDKLPKLKSNPNAFSGKGYHFYDSSGQELSPTSVNWDAYSGGSFPIRIVQSPGNANALGKIRFTIESPFSVYLHGTPDQQLFKKAHRALSSGCIRVFDPVKLAEFVFDSPGEWTHKRITDEASGTRTKKVKLEKSLPVFITYFTVFEDENSEWHFVKDGYAQDNHLQVALEQLRK
jgi:murein L,D-transpeptidase YcbB/YkuD